MGLDRQAGTWFNGRSGRVRSGAGEVADQSQPAMPSLATVMDEAEHNVPAYPRFPWEHRTNVVGVFPNEAAIRRGSYW